MSNFLLSKNQLHLFASYLVTWPCTLARSITSQQNPLHVAQIIWQPSKWSTSSAVAQWHWKDPNDFYAPKVLCSYVTKAIHGMIS